jgi:hypothetical protein
LDIEDLVAAVDGTLRDERATNHLASCSVCHRDAARWRVVGLGVRHFVEGVAPADTPVFDKSVLKGPVVAPFVPAAEARARGGHLRRWALVAVAAAAALAIAGGWYGVTAARGGGNARPATRGTSPSVSAGLIAVNGCPNLAGVSGTLEAVNGSDLVIRTADGQSVTIATSPSTRIGSEDNGTLGDINDGAQVVVSGAESNGTITAATVAVGAIDKVKPFEPPQPSDRSARVTVGAVTDVHAGGFTMVTSDGTTVAVTTSGSTTVIALRTRTANQLQIGGFIVAVGNTSGSDGALVAGAVEHVPNPISLPQAPSSGKGTGAVCSPESVVTALLAHA